MKLKIKKLHEDAIMPTRNNPTDSGLDLYTVEDIAILPLKRQVVSTGISIELPRPDVFGGNLKLVYEAQVRPRSGLALKHGISIVNSPGTVDNSYRGEIKVILLNTNAKDMFFAKKGTKIAQLVVSPVIIVEPEFVEELSDTDRGEKGFGSSG